jgi:hypothetical protein
LKQNRSATRRSSQLPVLATAGPSRRADGG